MGAKLHGGEKLFLLLSQGGPRAVRRAREQMKRQGEAIAKQAQKYAPVDHKGPGPGLPPGRELERSIESHKNYESNRRLQMVVNVGGVVDGVDVDDYVMEMHEGLAPYGSGEYQLGPASVAKGAGVGGKFLERAFREREDKLVDEIVAEIEKEFD